MRLANHVGGQGVNLLVHEDGAWHLAGSAPGGVTCIVLGVINPDDTAAAWVIGVTECQVLIVKARVDDADDDSGAVITLRQTVIGAVEDLPCMCHNQCGVGAQFQELADFHIGYAGHPGNLGQLVHGNLGRGKVVKFAVDDYPLGLQGLEYIPVVKTDESVHHFNAVDDAGWSELGWCHHRDGVGMVRPDQALLIGTLVKEA